MERLNALETVCWQMATPGLGPRLPESRPSPTTPPVVFQLVPSGTANTGCKGYAWHQWWGMSRGMWLRGLCAQNPSDPAGRQAGPA